MDQNAYPSPYPVVPSKYDDDHDQELHPFVPDIRASSSSSTVFFHTIQDGKGRHEQQLGPLQHHQDHNYTCNGGSPMPYEVKWKKEDPEDVLPEIKGRNDNANPVKLMSSKTKLMRKMKKNHDGLGLNLTSYCTTKKSSYAGTDSGNDIYSHDDIPIRVCSVCNTSKTPLWRSGPKGPKSLCNACGIKQRKARRAAASAAAAAIQQRALGKIKMKLKEKAPGKNPQASLLMKRSEMERTAANIAGGSKSNGQLAFEDLLMKLSKKYLTFHRVFPEDEKDAAILLMALSSGLLHG